MQHIPAASMIPKAWRKIRQNSETTLSAGLKSSSHSMLKCNHLQSRPGAGYSSCSEGSRHIRVDFTITLQDINWVLCHWPSMFTAIAHKHKHIQEFPPATSPETNSTLCKSMRLDLDWAAVASCPRRIPSLEGEYTGRWSAAIPGIIDETPNVA